MLEGNGDSFMERLKDPAAAVLTLPLPFSFFSRGFLLKRKKKKKEEKGKLTRDLCNPRSADEKFLSKGERRRAKIIIIKIVYRDVKSVTRTIRLRIANYLIW